MNILAHAYLSGPHEAIAIGNFIGDFIKGDPAHARHGLTPGELAGVRLHRAIDSFTDAHPDVAAVRTWLHPRCHKYAGAAVDVFFDHFLARHFTELTGLHLPAFTADFYQLLLRNTARLPARALRMRDALIQYDWLTNYQTRSGIDQSLKGMARRTAFPSGLDTAIADFDTYYDAIEGRFRSFWPQLVADMTRVRTELLATT